jgi:hypothetical protein
MVIRHIGPTDWERLRFTDELDVIGPVAQPALREWGPCFPFNGHFGLPAISLARHGCYLTGIGGDEVFQLSERNRLGAVSARDVAIFAPEHWRCSPPAPGAVTTGGECLNCPGSSPTPATSSSAGLLRTRPVNRSGTPRTCLKTIGATGDGWP